MKRRLSLFAFLALGLASPVPAAQNLPTVTPERIQKLQALHKKAEQQIVVNNFRGAINTYQEILLFEPDDETAYANMGQIYLLFSEFKKAENAFQNALSINPENEAALAGLNKITDRTDGYSYPGTGPGQPSRSNFENSEDPTG